MQRWRNEILQNNSVLKIHSKWSHPPQGHVKFNCNAAVGKELSIVAVVAKVSRGTMVLDASKKANTIILLQVGVKAIRWAVQLAKARNLEREIIESNSLA